MASNPDGYVVSRYRYRNLDTGKIGNLQLWWDDYMSTVAIDFDGVIHSYERGWQDGSIYGTIITGTLKAVTTIMNKHAVFVFTSRDPKQVAAWIEEHSVGTLPCTTVWTGPFWNTMGTLLVTNKKLPAIAYVDDRAVRFLNWDQTLVDLGLKEEVSDLSHS